MMVKYQGQIDVMSSPAIYHRSISLTRDNRVNKEYERALKNFLMEMRKKNFDEIKLSTYRAAAKLVFVQTTTSLNLVDIYNVIEAFRENGLNTLDHTAEIDEPRLECIIASIYYSLYKRLPSKTDIDVEKCIAILTQWIMHAYDRDGIKKIRVLSVKTALSTLCEGRLVDKLRYVYTQISESNGILNVAKLDNYLRDLLTLPCAVGEEPNFGYSEDILESFIKPTGVLERTHTKLDEFLEAFLNEQTNGVLYWLHMLHKICKASEVEHLIQCKGCGVKSFLGLRYKCLHCYNYHFCQDCFWREKVSGSHKRDHDMREYTTWNKSDKGSTVRNKLLCSPSPTSPRLPDYPKEPEPNKMLDMSNIVPPLPCEPCSPSSTLPRSPKVRNSESQHSTLSKGSSNFSAFLDRQDEEHSLIKMYAQRLAACALNNNSLQTESRSLPLNTSAEQKIIITSLEEKNKFLLHQINQLKAEHEETINNAQQLGCDPNLLTELRVLRLRKDELEMRMSALQETRRELMVQLEGLMKLLKNNQINSPRIVPRVSDEPRPSIVSITSNTSSTLMRGVNGEVKEAFGKSGAKEVSDQMGDDLQADLLAAVEEVASAMTTVVTEIRADGTPFQEYDEQQINVDVVVAVSSAKNTVSNTEVTVY
ncbi:dystrobrevin beta isoform X5 [Hydra vulgaris]|uniref:Dystrobrevin beta isoform X5 n=2 Tax=Hydra vulgaris TaxID=6087 RepID=A0ABM4C3Z4_HYDVU